MLSINEYQGLENYLMSQRVRSVLGYHGNELQRYDELLGGKNEWRNIGSPNLLKLLAVRYVIINEPISTTLLTPVGVGPLATADGQSAYLYRVTDPVPYAFLVEEALQLGDSQTVATLMDHRFDLRRILLVSPDQHIGLASLVGHEIPEPLLAPVAVHELRPGALRFDLGAPRATPAVSLRVRELSPGLARHGRWPPGPRRSGPALPDGGAPAGRRPVDRALIFSPGIPAGRNDHPAGAAGGTRYRGRGRRAASRERADSRNGPGWLSGPWSSFRPTTRP